MFKRLWGANEVIEQVFWFLERVHFRWGDCTAHDRGDRNCR